MYAKLLLYIHECILLILLYILQLRLHLRIFQYTYLKIFQIFSKHISVMFSNIDICVCGQLLSPVQLFATSWTEACQAPPWNFPGKNTGVGCHFHLQGIFLTQGLNCISYIGAGRFFTWEALLIFKYLLLIIVFSSVS